MFFEKNMIMYVIMYIFFSLLSKSIKDIFLISNLNKHKILRRFYEILIRI